MKRSFSWFVVAIVLIGVGLVAISFTMKNAIGLSSIEVPKVVYNLRDLPLYPNAQLVKADTQSDSWSYHASYSTSGSYVDVLAYYKDVLPSQGWVVVKEDYFTWTDTAGTIPWNVSLIVGGHEVFRNGETGFSLIASRRPNINSIPIYPGAQQVEMQDKKSSEDDWWDNVKVTTYSINAKPSDIESYYKSTLQEYAWNFDPKSGSIDSDEGIYFGAHLDTGGNSTLVALQIVTNTGTGDQTQVELRLKTKKGSGEY